MTTTAAPSGEGVLRRSLGFRDLVVYFAVRRRGGPVRPLAHVVVPLLGAAITIAVITQAAGSAQIVGGLWLVVGLIVLAVQRSRRTAPDA